jgi:hypothetical protein
LANDYLMPIGSSSGKGGKAGLDIMSSDVVRISAVPAGSGSSGVQVVFKISSLTDAFKPASVVRVCPEGSQGMRFVTIAPEERADANLPPQILRPDTKP